MVRHVFTRLCVYMLFIALAGCGQAPAPRDFGTLSMALTATSESGINYRLRGGQVVLSGATQASIDLDAAYVDDALIAVRIATGQYELGLKEGWSLERDSGQGYAPVEAEFISPNPQFLSVNHNETTRVHLNFQAGSDALTLASGDLEVDLNVTPECTEGEWVARGCGPGFEGQEIARCEGGIWSEFEECVLPDMSTEPICGPTETEPYAKAQGESPAEDAEGQSLTEEEELTPSVTTEADEDAIVCQSAAHIAEKHASITLEAITGDENATDFYGYGGANATGAVSTYTEPKRTSVMLHKGPNDTYALIVVNGAQSEANQGGKIGLSITEHQGIRLSAWDGETSDRLNMSTGEFKWEWNACCTDGIAIEMHEDTSCISMHFVQGEGIEGVDVVLNASGERASLTTPFDPFTLCLPQPCEDTTSEESAAAPKAKDALPKAEEDVHEEVSSLEEDTEPAEETSTQLHPAQVEDSEEEPVERAQSATEEEEACKSLSLDSGVTFIVCDGEKTWVAAANECTDMGGSLATIHSPEEQSALEALSGQSARWIGLTDRVVEGDFQWIDGSKVDFTHWNTGEPNEVNGGEDCAHLWPSGTWNDSNCDTPLPYACRLPPLPAQSEQGPLKTEAPSDDEDANNQDSISESPHESAEERVVVASEDEGRVERIDNEDEEEMTHEPDMLDEDEDEAEAQEEGLEATLPELGDAKIGLLTEMAHFETVSEDFEVFVEDFETFADGSEVQRAKTGFVEGDGFFHADKVTFESWSASTLTQHADTDQPVADGVQVAGDSSKWQQGLEYYGCAWEGGDAAILGTSGPNKTSGFEAIQANFSSPVRSVAFDVSVNRFGYYVDVFVEGQEDEPFESFRVESFESTVIGAYVSKDSPGIISLRVTPIEHGLGGYGVWWWSVWSVSFAN